MKINTLNSKTSNNFYLVTLNFLEDTSSLSRNLSSIEKQDRQLDLIALPLGIATGIFLGSILTPTTTTTTTTEAPSAELGAIDSSEISSSGISSQLEVSGSDTSSRYVNFDIQILRLLFFFREKFL